MVADQLLAPDPTARIVLGGKCLFWGLRWCAQFVAFPPALWRAPMLFAVGHIGFGLLWTWILLVFVLALIAG